MGVHVEAKNGRDRIDDLCGRGLAAGAASSEFDCGHVGGAFGGAYLSDWRLAFAVPLSALLLRG